MTFFFRYLLLRKRKLRKPRKSCLRKRRKLLESTESPLLVRVLQQQLNNDEQETVVEVKHAEDELLMELPTSILADVLSRLSFKQVCVCRCVCKLWRSVTESPDFTSLYLERGDMEIFLRSDSAIFDNRTLYLIELQKISAWTPQPRFTPWQQRAIMSVRSMDVRARVFLPGHESFYTDIMKKTRNVNSSSGAKPVCGIVNSCNGFICLRKTSLFHIHKNPRVVCNPFTGEFTFIPKPETKRIIKIGPVVSGFGCSLGNNVFKVVRLVYGVSVLNPFDRTFEVYTLGSDSWRTVGKAPCDTIQDSTATFLNGAIHWISESESEDGDAVKGKSILCFDFADEKFDIIHLPSPFLEKLSGKLSKCKLSLGVLRSCLCVSGVVEYVDQFDIWVMRNYCEHESWTMEFSLRVHVAVVCQPIKWLENGDLLVFLDRRDIMVYNPRTNMFRKFKIQGVKSVVSEAITHIPSFSLLKDITGGNNVVVHNAEQRWNEDAETISLMEDIFGMDFEYNNGYI